jgi:ribosomal protein S6--L-glutamate ligase
MTDRPVLGYIEWATFTIGATALPPTEVKVDSGAKRTALHAEDITPFSRDGAPWVRFTTSPNPLDPASGRTTCEAPVLRELTIYSSNRIGDRRYVISADLRIGELTFSGVEITLANRADMGYRVLLGRESMPNCLIDPHTDYLHGGPANPRRPTKLGNAES